jgi:hypothetical protein
MKPDEIDEALRRGAAWEPPPGFARRISRLARLSQLDEPPVRFLDVVMQLPFAVRSLAMNFSSALAGFRWTLRQYWLLVAR